MIPFKETKAGKWLADHAPQVLETVGDFMPAPIKGTMNIVKNLVKLVPGITPDKVDEFNGIADEHEADIIKLHNEEMADARASNIQIQTSVIVPAIVKLRPTIMAFFVMIIWGALTIYITAVLCSIIKMDGAHNFEAVLALYSGVSIMAGKVLDFDFGSSAGSKAKQETIDTIMAANKS